MHELTRLIKEDMKPALGVTEPGAIAFAVATAKRHMNGDVQKVVLRLNSGMFKNAFTCGIPGSEEVGNYHAAALGAVAADPDKGLECLEGITGNEAEEAKAMVADGRIHVEMTEITSRIFIEAVVSGSDSEAAVTIRDSHTNIVRITENGKTVFEKEENLSDGIAEPNVQSQNPSGPAIHRYTLKELHQYALTVPVSEISFIKDAFVMNEALMNEGLESPKTTFARYLLRENGGTLVSEDLRKTAALFCGAAIEARVIGLSRPAMSITGSGAHGIIATMPLYAAFQVNKNTEEALLRATALSYLVCMYIKEYSGKLSAFCGCAIAAGTGTACGLVALSGGSTEQMVCAINNMAGSITGMICDGGNQGCVMKGLVASDTACASAYMAMNGIFIENVHGICGPTPEETMKNMGLIASPGMIGTEKVIVDILQEKTR